MSGEQRAIREGGALLIARLCEKNHEILQIQWNGEAHYGLVESFAGRDSIVRLLLNPRRS
jgi:hypothetical protein